MKRIVYEEDGELRVVIPVEGIPLSTVVARSVPKGTSFVVKEHTELPDEWEFFKAWKREKNDIKVDTEKARSIAHEIRRQIREKEFEPYDDIVSKRIPGKEKQAEYIRQSIRDHFAAVQEEIDKAATPAEMSKILKREAKNGVHIQTG